IFALLIGIDIYADAGIWNLSGCVSDCKRLETFLVGRMEVPERYICSLHNKAATRDAILTGFSNHLLDNRDITVGDVMIIFFMGHGSRVPAPEGWAPLSSNVETIQPHDEGMQKDGALIHGIPDRTIVVLMAQLACRKGDNI
ncbi:hypothetical protein WOLCODRAFT_59505, partial [Wolfiporia cocos MD-104 SS10]